MNYVRSMITQFAEDDQNRIALMVYDGRQITEVTYRCLAEKILRAADFFRSHGLSRRHIGLIGGNCYEWIVAYFGIVASGNVVVPLNPTYPIENVMAQCGLTDVSVICGDHQDISALTADYQWFGYDKLTSETPMKLEEIASPGREATVMLLYTSGTTGESKAVEITYANMESSLKSADGVFEEPEINRIMMALPMFHIAGIRGALAMLHRRKTLCVGRGVKYLFRDMPALLPDYISLVPLMVESLVKIIKRTSRANVETNYIGPNLKRICVGGASIDPDSCRYLMKEGFCVDSGYALSETTGVGTWGKWDDQHIGTIGKLSRELQYRIVDGELQLKGEAVMKGYYNDPEATQTAMEDGWLHTGDLGYCDEDGYFYLTGRKKSVIAMPNGEKINPEEIEQYFNNCDEIEECLIRLDDNDQTLCIEVFANSADVVRDYIKQYNERMPLSHNIHKVVYRDRPLERTTSGKLIRKER